MYKITAWLLIIWFPFFIVTPVYAQFDDDESFFTDDTDESGELETGSEGDDQPSTDTEDVGIEPEMSEDAVFESDESIFGPEMGEDVVTETEESVGETPVETGVTETGLEFTEEPGTQIDQSKASAVQNAVLEGIQLSSEPGVTADERIITCYFIFRDKPTSYFYEAKLKQKTIVFEFNDVVLGASPIPSAKETPIQGFRIESEKVDANREVVGLNPEWHDILKVSFYFDAIPEITVKDEYSVISFSFKWSTDPEKQKVLVQKETNKALLFSLIGGGVALGGLGAVLILLKDDTQEEEKDPLSTIWEDGIKHPDDP